MFSIRLTALSCAAAFAAGIVSTLYVWSYVERGRTIEENELHIASQAAVTDLVSDRATREKEQDHEKDKRIKELEAKIHDRKTPMSPAVRAAIDSLPR